MREVLFIKQNKEKWLDFERLLQNGNYNPDVLASLYIQLLNDLSYSQTFYPKSKTTDYLNFLVSQIYRKIYKTKRLERNRLSYFFIEEVPEIVFRYRKQLMFAFATFLFFAVLGAVSAKYDQTFVRLILGDNYVNSTLQNIENGDPMAVYKSGGKVEMFLGITFNNLYVAADAYIKGATAGILTFYAVLRNAIMLGSFQYFFYEQGVLVESLKGIWLHGAMEIFAIIISAAAGFILASSILFPKMLSRISSFKIGVKESLKVFISIIPFFVAAGFIEGFVTRYSNTMPLWINLLIIFGTLSIISFYYLIFPFIKKHPATKIKIIFDKKF